MDISMEIDNAILLLSRMNTVDDLVRFWKVYGPNKMFPYPRIEAVPEGWYRDLFEIQ